VAGLVRLVRRGAFPRHDTVVVNLTGRDRPPADISRHVHWLRPCADGWEPDGPSKERTLSLWHGPMLEEAVP
jgi:hypothetical protein